MTPSNSSLSLVQDDGPPGRGGVIPLQFQDDPLLWAGWLHAQDGMTQNDIAKVMGVSRATVNGYLAEARARGIVTLAMDAARLGELAVAQALKNRFRLDSCVVVPAADAGRSLVDRLGVAGARVLRSMVKPGDRVGVSWGRTVMAVARAVIPSRVPDVEIVQVTGGLTATYDFSPELCTSRLAQAFDARSVNITAPAMVSSAAVRDVLMAEPMLVDQIRLARGVDKLLFGIGSTRADSLVHESQLITPENLADASAHRATAIVAGRLIDDRGRAIAGRLDERTIGLTLDEIARIGTRVAVAGGSDKVAAILAVLRGGFASVLVTDATTGAGILQAEGVPEAPSALRGSRKLQVQGGGLVLRTKKLVNDADMVVEEMLEGVVRAHPEHVRQLPEHPRAVLAVGAPRPGKVGIVVGGGSGHEPTFLGFVGKGLADACAVGNVFASPPPDPILECTKAVDGGAGVVYLFGNYAGDVMNFEMAAELAALEDLNVRIVVTTDDIASAPREEREKRRGVAGNFFVFKMAGAAADRMLPIEEVERVAHKANDAVFTVGVALSPCSLPQTRRPNFEIGENEMELGMGIHGEPGIRREPLKTADEVVDDIMERIFAELPEGTRKVAVLVNSLGSTPLMELYVINRRVHQRLERKGIAVHRTWVGAYCTSLEMAGMSITVAALDDELTGLLDHPCDCAMFRAG